MGFICLVFWRYAQQSKWRRKILVSLPNVIILIISLLFHPNRWWSNSTESSCCPILSALISSKWNGKFVNIKLQALSPSLFWGQPFWTLNEVSLWFKYQETFDSKFLQGSQNSSMCRSISSSCKYLICMHSMPLISGVRMEFGCTWPT